MANELGRLAQGVGNILNSIMPEPEYMKTPMGYFPEEIIQQYQLESIVHKGHIYIKIKKGMYGVPQAEKLANEELTEHLALYGYCPVWHTPGLWQHTTRDIRFTLVVDDFGEKYTNKEDVQHLLQALRD
eukprot:6399304-Ditylum_brightwellii.AAC.1